jgi:protein-arginine kinase activator protein McsA
MIDLVVCRHCGEYDAFLKDGEIYWPNGSKYICHTCGTEDTYYPQKEEVSEAQAKIDALRLREGPTQAELDTDALLHARIAHEMMLVARRGGPTLRSQDKVGEKVIEYEPDVYEWFDVTDFL